MEEKPIQVKTIVVRTGRIVCDIEAEFLFFCCADIIPTDISVSVVTLLIKKTESESYCEDPCECSVDHIFRDESVFYGSH